MIAGVSLREYQQRGIADLRAAYSIGKRAPIYVSPTGSGKTRVAAEIIKLARSKGNRALALAPRVELVDQLAAALRDAGIEPHVIQGSRGRDIPRDAECYVASIPTLTADLERIPVDIQLVIVDECHGSKARTRMELLSKYPDARLLGLSATPARGDGSALGDVFDAIVVGPTVDELVSLGHLVPTKVFAPPQILNPRELALEPLDAYERHCRGRRTLVFAATVEHARRIAHSFEQAGVRARYVTGESPDRSEILSSYARGDLDVLVNVSICIEGWDDPPTSAAIFARRFTFAGPYLQACGRPMRPLPGKSDSVIVDLCGSALVHGTPDAEREYSLDGKGIKRGDREALRQCAACGGVQLAGPTMCRYCGAALPVAHRSLPQATGQGVSELAVKQKPTSWPMRAKKRGLCAGCGGGIEPGAWIVYSRVRRTARHTSCAAKVEARSAA